MSTAERYLKPEVINQIKRLDLRRPIFQKTAAYGHFGRSEPEFTWEQVDAEAADLRNAAAALA